MAVLALLFLLPAAGRAAEAAALASLRRAAAPTTAGSAEEAWSGQARGFDAAPVRAGAPVLAVRPPFDLMGGHPFDERFDHEPWRRESPEPEPPPEPSRLGTIQRGFVRGGAPGGRLLAAWLQGYNDAVLDPVIDPERGLLRTSGRSLPGKAAATAGSALYFYAAMVPFLPVAAAGLAVTVAGGALGGLAGLLQAPFRKSQPPSA